MAFAAVISLEQTIERLPILTKPAYTELNSLRFMLEKLDDESSRRIDRSAINAVDAKIRDAVWKLEDFLESCSRPLSHEINSFLKTVKELGEEYESALQTPLPAEEDTIDDDAAAASPATVGLSDLYTQIRTQLLERAVNERGLEQEIVLFLKMTNALKGQIVNDAAVSRRYNYSTMVGFADLCTNIRSRLLERAVDEEGLEQVIDLFLKMAMKAIHDVKEIRSNSTTVRLSDLSEQIRTQLLAGIVDKKGFEQEIDLFLKMAMKLKEHIIDDADAVSRIHNYSPTVGLSHLSTQIISDKLLEGTTERKSVSLVGMAGIGKTHLTRDICSHPHILQHFEVRALVRAGPKYKDPMNIVVDILTQIEGESSGDVFKNQSLDTLEYLLRNSLRGRRYLIVLDDVWTTTALNDCIRCIPANNNGSRFLLTTRLLEVADEFEKYEMPFLNKEESWNLLWQNVFVGESYFPFQLEKAGRKIAENCEGLPLLILAVAHILRRRKPTEEYWHKVAEKENSTFTDACDRISEVLLPSYEYLPQHLKPCFLYMGVFPQSREIVLSKLTDFWTVEDILQLSLSQNLEVFAMECMQDLVSHSLAIVCKRRFNRIKSSKLHTAYWRMCVVEARKTEFFHVFNKLTDVVVERSRVSRRLAIQNNMLFGIKKVYNTMSATTSATRSLLCTGDDHQYQVPICFDVMILIKVLDALAVRFYEFPNDVVELLQLRYLSLTHNGEVPSSISNLQQLEWLTLFQHHNIKMVERDSTTYLPEKIWVMKTLKHLRIMGSVLPDPSKGSELPNLSTLYVNADSCTEEVFKSIPNLKKLGIKIELHPESGAETVRCLEHIGVLTKLKSLKCVVVNPRLSRLPVAPQEHLSKLPKSLEMLTLNGLGYSWEYMNAIASLPFLKKLKLQCSAFQGPEWETKAVGQFQRLEFLLLEDMDLVHWIVEGEKDEEEEDEEEKEEEEEDDDDDDEDEDEDDEEEEKKDKEEQEQEKEEVEEEDSFNKSFRSLRHLIVRHCYKMKKMPWKVLSLERMELDECIPSLMASLHRIRYKARQLSYERKYSHLKAVINSSWHL